MSNHLDLLEQNIPLANEEHLSLVRERRRQMEKEHEKRISNLKLERRILTGDVWVNEPNEDERRVTVPIAHNAVNLGASLLLPSPPDITILPISRTPAAQFEADAVQRWTYAALDNLRWDNVCGNWAKELMFGVAGLHMIPDKFALEGEMPILLDIPDSVSMLYHTGPRGGIDYCLLKHRLSVRDIKRTFNVETPGRDTDEIDVWCYYAEERIIRNGKADKMVLYGILKADAWLYPLTDVTDFLPDIPVFLAFNADGYEWKGREEMRAYGVLTPVQELLLYADDYMSQLANGMLRAVNPPIKITQDPNNKKLEPDMRPGGASWLWPGESIDPVVAAQPQPQTTAFFGTLEQQIGDATFPQVFSTKPQDITGVSGSTFSESQQPINIKNGRRQSNFEGAIQLFITAMLRYMAKVIDPRTGFELYGVDPRDRKQIQQMVHPAMLLNNTRVRVELSHESPRNVMQWVTLIQQLSNNGIISRNLASEMAAKWMKLPVTDMTSLSSDIASDDAYKMQLDVMREQSLQMFPHVRQQLNQQHLNPNVQQNGQMAYRLGAQGQNPLSTHEVEQPTSHETQYPMARRPYLEGAPR